MQLLIWLAVIDILTGIAAAAIQRTVSSDASWRGMIKKSMMFVCVATGTLVERHVGTAGVISILGVSVGLGAGLAGSFCLTEGVSIIENLGRSGVPIPAVITERLFRLRSDVWGPNASTHRPE
jgi:toxin secretion/phage lysis holin